MKTTTGFNTTSLPHTFEKLCGAHMLRPIVDVAGFEDAQEIADALAVLDCRTPDQDDYLESLSVLMEHFEETLAPISCDELTPIEALK